MAQAGHQQRHHGRPYDVVVFGASGFTGKYVVREALKFLANDDPSSFATPFRTLALAGRDPAKVAEALLWASAPSPPPPLPIVQADVTDPPSLLSVCRQARLVLNCVGPFRLYGEPVVAACVEAGTDYLDVSGEPEFMEQMEASYHGRAAEVGSLVVSACGSVSVPAELGFMFNSRQWVPPAVPSRIEAYVSLESDKKMVVNAASYASAVLGTANGVQLQQLRRSRPPRARPLIPGPPPRKGPLIEHRKELGRWSIKLPTADAIVVRRTLAALTGNPGGLEGANESNEQTEKRRGFWSTVKPAHFGVRFISKSYLEVLRLMLIGTITRLLASITLGTSLLLRFPELFSLGWARRTGPTEDELKSDSFKMLFVGCGYSDGKLALESGGIKPDREIITRVSGPEGAYIATPIILIQCALIVLGERERPPKEGSSHQGSSSVQLAFKRDFKRME